MQYTLPERLLNRGFCFGHIKYFPYYPIMFWGGEDHIIIGRIKSVLFTGRKYIPVKKFFDDIDDIKLIKLKDITFVETDNSIDYLDYRRKNSFEDLSRFTEQRTNKGLGKQEIKDWIDHIKNIKEFNPTSFPYNITIWV